MQPFHLNAPSALAELAAMAKAVKAGRLEAMKPMERKNYVLALIALAVDAINVSADARAQLAAAIETVREHEEHRHRIDTAIAAWEQDSGRKLLGD